MKGKGWLISLVVVGMILLFGFMSAVSTYNKAMTHENTIKASWEQMQNVNGTLINKLRSHGFTANNYSETFIKSIEANVQRYANDKNLLFKFVNESQAQAPDPQIWIKIQNAIEAGYSEFEYSQKHKIEMTRVYRNFYTKFPNNVMLGFYNLPSPEVKTICDKIISTAETKKTFETGEMESVNPFGE